MTMPVTLTLIRHGESESNLAKRAAERGKPLTNEAELMKLHTSERRLTPRGVAQAQKAGLWLKEYLKTRKSVAMESRYYVSPYVRAMETAGHLGLGVRWRTDVRLCERNWGDFETKTYVERVALFGEQLSRRKTEAFFWRPSNGETMQDVFLRIRDHLATLHRECHYKDVVEVLHGETMWVYLTILLYLSPSELAEWMKNSETDQTIWIMNCRVIQFTRERDSGELDPKFVSYRFVDPSDPMNSVTNSGWRSIHRRTFSDLELLGLARKYPQVVAA